MVCALCELCDEGEFTNIVSLHEKKIFQRTSRFVPISPLFFLFLLTTLFYSIE